MNKEQAELNNLIINNSKCYKESRLDFKNKVILKDKENNIKNIENKIKNIEGGLDYTNNAKDTPLILFFKSFKNNKKTMKANVLNDFAELDYRLMNFLLKYTSDINHQNLKGRTALMEAITSFHFNFTKETVKDFSWDLSIQDNKGKTAFMLLADCANKINTRKKNEVEEVFSFLKEISKSQPEIIEQFDNQGNTTFYQLMNGGTDFSISEFLKFNPDLSLNNKKSENGIIICAKKNNFISEVILDYVEKNKNNFSREIDFNQQDNKGNTALFYATKPNIIERLINMGVSLDIVNDRGESALDYMSCDNANVAKKTASLIEKNILEKDNKKSVHKKPRRNAL